MSLLFIHLLFLLTGLIIGSFIAAVSYRIPKGITFIKGRSYCPRCKDKISWYDNIPLFSYMLLKGKCRKCKNKISLRYPFIEVISGLSFLFISFYMGLGLLKIIFFLVVFSVLLTILVIDLENQIIPDSLVWIVLGIIFFYTLFLPFNPHNFFGSLVAGFLASSFLLLINLFTKGRGMGLGDVKFAIMGGMLVGLELMPIWILLSFLTGALVGSILILVNKAGMKTKIAFGPFLITALLLTIIFGNKLLLIFSLL